MSTGQDPTHELAHSLGYKPGKNRVMCLVYGGKSILWYVTSRGLCGTRKRVFPFSVKQPLLLRLREGQGSEVFRAHSLQCTKPTDDGAIPITDPEGRSVK